MDDEDARNEIGMKFAATTIRKIEYNERNPMIFGEIT